MGGYADPAYADAMSPYGGGGSAAAIAAVTASQAGSGADWYAAEIASREAAAAANTESSPSSSTGGGQTTFYVDPRTGEMYANYEQFLAQNPTGVSVPVWSTPGVPVVTPTGETFYSRYSQYWMDPAYTGPEPSLKEQAALSSADYARDFAGELLAQYGTTAAPAVQQKAAVYKSASTLTTTPRTLTQQIEDLTGGNDVVAQGVDWIKNNLLIIVIVIAGIFVLPRFLDAAVPTRRR